MKKVGAVVFFKVPFFSLNKKYTTACLLSWNPYIVIVYALVCAFVTILKVQMASENI